MSVARAGTRVLEQWAKMEICQPCDELAVGFSEERGERCGAIRAILLASIGGNVRTALGGFA